MFEELSLKQYNDQLASNAPTPGGGSALAQAGAMACSLAQMSANVTLANKDLDEQLRVHLTNKSNTIAHAQKALYKLSDEDACAYQRVVSARRLSKDTEAQASERQRQLQKAYHSATTVPLDVMRLCRELIRICTREILPYTSKYVRSDCEIAVALLRTVAQNSMLNVQANAKCICNAELRANIERQGKDILNEIATL